MTSAEINTIANKLEELGRGDLADQFLKNPNAFDFTVLERDPNFTDKYANVAGFVGDKYKVLQDLYVQFDGKKPTDTRFESLKVKYPFLDRNELNEWFDKTNEFKKEYEQERENEAKRQERVKEVERDWPLPKKLVTTDYEKQRYINEPEKALFGEQAPSWGSAENTRWRSMGDLAAGALGTAADLVPTPVHSEIWAGPVVRGLLDASYYGTPYQRKPEDIISDLAQDMSINAGAELFQNWRRAKRGERKLLNQSSDLARHMNVVDETKNISGSINKIENLINNKAGVTDIVNAINELPDSELKKELMSKTSGPLREVRKGDVEEILNNYRTYISERTKNDYVKELGSKFYEPKPMPNVPQEADDFALPNNEYMRRVLLAPDKLSKIDKAKEQGIRLFDFAYNNISTPVTKFAGRETANLRKFSNEDKKNIVANILAQEEQKDNINRIISSYSLLWNKDKPPMEAKDSPLIEAAWKKWKKEQE